MRKFLIAGWLMLPVGAWAYHEGPGQERQMLDAVDVELAKAEGAVARAEAAEAKKGLEARTEALKVWAEAATHFEAALKELPELTTDERKDAARRIRLSSAKAKMNASDLEAARNELIDIVDELEAEESPNQALLAEAKEGYGTVQYYWTYMMRLEGYAREDWEPEIEIARQNFRFLAERDSAERGVPASRKADDQRINLEAAIQLARMDLDELQGLPLPSQ